jgi:glutamate carboxypeptidase
MASPDRMPDLGRQACLAASRDSAERAASRMDVYERRLRVLVDTDTGLDDPHGRDAAAAMLAEWAAVAGCTTELVQHPAGLHLVAALPGDGHGRVVLLGHHDTVFPCGTAAERPYTSDGHTAFGPGVADMKGGLLVGLNVLEALAAGPRHFASVELHSVPDEEVRTTPLGTLDRLLGADAVLVLECGRENGDLVSGRKTGAWLQLGVTGRPAHAGTEPELGSSAVLGLCREILRCSELDGVRPGVTVIAGTLSGGTLANVVPDHAGAMLDVRALCKVDLEWAIAELGRFGRYDGLTVQMNDAGTWPGIEQGAAGRQMLSEALMIARALGTRLDSQTSGGMSDGCWTAAAGIPTLDGFGPVGGRDHAPGEFIELTSVPTRCGIVAGLCAAVGLGLTAGQSAPKGGSC